MKTKIASKFIPIILALLLTIVFIPGMAAAAQLPVTLGEASTFAVLAGSAITNTGTTTFNGNAADVGVSPGNSFTGQETFTTSGSINIANNLALIAKTALVTAYNDVAGRTPFTTIAADLGGTTLVPGVYRSESSIQITGILTLDAQGDSDAIFIFQAGSALTTASGSEIVLINGAQYGNVFWQIGSSATLGTTSDFSGSILAMESITATTGVSIHGKLLARDGAVTLDGVTLTNDLPVPTLTPSVTPSVSPTSSNPATGNIPANTLPLWIFLIISSAAILFQFLKLRSRRS
ncbi:MAG: ice-binding family protein [Saccharofermentanales bacterium]